MASSITKVTPKGSGQGIQKHILKARIINSKILAYASAGRRSLTHIQVPFSQFLIYQTAVYSVILVRPRLKWPIFLVPDAIKRPKRAIPPEMIVGTEYFLVPIRILTLNHPYHMARMPRIRSICQYHDKPVVSQVTIHEIRLAYEVFPDIRRQERYRHTTVPLHGLDTRYPCLYAF